MKIDRKKTAEAFSRYAEQYDLSDLKIRLKYDHTFRVAELSDRIAQSLSLPGDDCDLAWLLGILHDIGRFEQLRRFGTFQDKVSVNHAALSADLLFRQGLIADFVTDSSENSLMEKAVRLHNVLSLPEMTEREYVFCTILRDADKIDIVRVNAELPRTEIYDLPEEAFTDSAVSDAVFDDILHERNVDRTNVRPGIDLIIGQISFVFGLVWPESVRLMKDQGYLARVLGFQSRNAETRRRMQVIRQKVSAYMDRRIRENSSLPPKAV
ncbi:MAG: HD domain-containing protein [Lachnospiraceae bacterium]